MGGTFPAKRELACFFAMCSFGLIFMAPATAQFSVKSPKVEKGEVEFEIHGSFQSGLPKEEEEEEDPEEEAEDDVNEKKVILEKKPKSKKKEEGEEEEEEVRHGHEISIGYGVTDFWKAEIGIVAQKFEGGDFEATSLEFENTLELFSSDRATLGFLAAISFGVNDVEPHAFEFGPLVEFGDDEKSLILNGIFEKTFGENREEGMGFEYAAQAKFAVAKRIGLGVEAFGEIENILDVPSFDETELRVGPAIFFTTEEGNGDEGKNGNGNGNGKNGKGKGDDNGEDESLKRGEEVPEVEAAIGVLFGVTDATPDVTLKWDIEITF